MEDTRTDADKIMDAVHGVPAEPYLRSNDHAMMDYDGLPALVRGFLSINQGNATETWNIEEAGMMPRLYGTHEGERVRVVMVSSLGDIGISRHDVESGYFKRCSIYDLTDFSDEMHPDVPSKKPKLRYYTIVDAKGRWIDETLPDTGAKMLSRVVSEPRLFVEKSTANAIRRRFDEYGLLGYRTIPVQLSKAAE